MPDISSSLIREPYSESVLRSISVTATDGCVYHVDVLSIYDTILVKSVRESLMEFSDFRDHNPSNLSLFSETQNRFLKEMDMIDENELLLFIE